SGSEPGETEAAIDRGQPQQSSTRKSLRPRVRVRLIEPGDMPRSAQATDERVHHLLEVTAANRNTSPLGWAGGHEHGFYPRTLQRGHHRRVLVLRLGVGVVLGDLGGEPRVERGPDSNETLVRQRVVATTPCEEPGV